MIPDWALYARAAMTRSSCYEVNLEIERERERRYYKIRRICYPFPIGIKLDYIVLRRIYLDIEKLIISSLRAFS